MTVQPNQKDFATELVEEAEKLRTTTAEIRQAAKAAEDKYEEAFREQRNALSGLKADNAENAALAKKMSDAAADAKAEMQALRSTLDEMKRTIDAPVVKGGKDLQSSDRRNAIEIQRQHHMLRNGGLDDGFRADMSNLINFDELRGAMRHVMKVGIIQKEDARRLMTDGERRAYDASGFDNALFQPEMLGYEQDCNIMPAFLDDLYGSVAVNRSTFQYTHILNYGDMGAYGCQAMCDTPPGVTGNIEHKSQKTHEFRGMFCFQRKVLQESSYDLMGFMVRSIQRSWRINQNRTKMIGDGVNEPLGWQKSGLFQTFSTPTVANSVGPAQSNLSHVDVRHFIASQPLEWGKATAVMHQNMFAYLSSMVDKNGRFIFDEDGMSLAFMPDGLTDRIRISNWLPDATNGNAAGTTLVPYPSGGNTQGSPAKPFTPGSFVAAIANWERAYISASKRPLWMEQYFGQSNAWCVKYLFGAEDGGFVGCPAAGRILNIG
jgi:hypothetical protein